MYCRYDNFIGIDFVIFLFYSIPYRRNEIFPYAGEVAGADYHLFFPVRNGKRRYRYRRFYIFGNTLCELSCQCYFFIGRYAYLRPTDFQFIHFSPPKLHCMFRRFRLCFAVKTAVFALLPVRQHKYMFYLPFRRGYTARIFAF